MQKGFTWLIKLLPECIGPCREELRAVIEAPFIGVARGYTAAGAARLFEYDDVVRPAQFARQVQAREAGADDGNTAHVPVDSHPTTASDRHASAVATVRIFR